MRLAIYTGIILAGGYTCLTPALAADPTGDWRVADGVANIRVAQCGGSMWGAVSWEKQPGGRDENNPDVSKEQADAGHGHPDRHEEEARRRSMGRTSLQREGRAALQRDHHPGWNRPARDQGLRDGLPVRRGDLDPSRAADPSSPANAMAKGMPKTTGTASKAAPTGSAAPATGAQKTAAAAKPGQKTAADPVGDICLLPEIAGFAH